MTILDDATATKLVTAAAERLRLELHLPWSGDTEHAVACLSLWSHVDPTKRPIPVGLLGGASSGKSTVFDNLLGGRLASRITARGHATLGPVLAVHEAHRSWIDDLFAGGSFLPGLKRVDAELDDNITGAPDEAAVVFHTIEALRSVLLFDLPDFTSGAAEEEGDIALTLLPWFDRILIVLDYERWFDRQSASSLRTRSVRFGQERWILFNCTSEAPCPETVKQALAEQTSHLAARGMSFLEFRRGRGLCRFPPGTFDDVLRFASSPPPDRRNSLRRFVADAANEVLNQNEERIARLEVLRRRIESLTDRTIPDRRSCMTALMTPEERRQTEWLGRVLRLDETRRWLSGHTRRLTAALRRVPVLGTMFAPSGDASSTEPNGDIDRTALGAAFAARVIERHRQELRRAVRTSAFWEELRRWTGLEPEDEERDDLSPETLIDEAVRDLDQAIRRWKERVETECQGLAPHAKGAIGVGTIALAVVLIAAPGPVTALTAVAAKGAIAATVTQLLAAAGAGALAGKPLTRLTSVVQEKLIGSPEFNAVQSAVGLVRSRLYDACAAMSARALDRAAELVLDRDDPLHAALERLRSWDGEES